MIGMKIALKGSPSWAINQDGEISVSTTWQCYNDTTDNVAIGWLRFQNEVEKFAGSVGDLYKAPVQDDNSKEATKYELSDAFIVQSVEYKAVDARTHYEVTFEHIQNFDTMTRVGGISVEVNENNERVKTAKYKVAATGDTVDSIIMHSGDTAVWAGELYYIRSSNYNPEYNGLYSIDITAVDMSYMRIGLPAISTDSQGNTIIQVTWRYSRAKYDETELPNAGDDAEPYIGKSGYVVTEVRSEPQGVLGYNVTITASSHTTYKVLHASKTVDKQDIAYTTTWETTFQADDTELSAISEAATYSDIASLLPEGKDFPEGKVESIQYDQYAPGKYNVRVRMSQSLPNGFGGGNSASGVGAWSVNVSQASIQLGLRQAGWGKGPSGELYQLNFPPTTIFRYTMSPDSIISIQTATGNTVPSTTATQLLATIKSKGIIGYDRIVGIQGSASDGTIRWLTDDEIKSITKLSDVQSIMLEGYVYAQPSQSIRGQSVRNQLFTPWDRDTECPLWFGTPTQYAGRDASLNEYYLRYKFKYHEITVTQTYNISPKTALKQPNYQFYIDAMRRIHCSNYTSYKAAGISFASKNASDAEGNGSVTTDVTCTIHALLSSNKGAPKWNKNYDNTAIKDEGDII